MGNLFELEDKGVGVDDRTLRPTAHGSRPQVKKKGRIGHEQGRIGRADRSEVSEGQPMPREPAYAAKRSQDGEAQAASE